MAINRGQVRLGAEQFFHDLRVPLIRSQVQRVPAVLKGSILVDASLQQRPHNVRMTQLTSHVQWAPAVLVGRIRHPDNDRVTHSSG